MKRILVTTALFALSTVSTLAADMAPRTYTKAPMVDPSYNWSGLYVGGDLGYQTSGLGLADPRQGVLTYDTKSDGFAGGGHIGYQHSGITSSWASRVITLGRPAQRALRLPPSIFFRPADWALPAPG